VKIDTLLLDLDGTLVDSNDLILETLRQTIARFFPEVALSPAQLLEMMGPPLYETFGKLTPDPAVVESMIRAYRKIYVGLEFHYIRIYPSVLETLQHFHEKKFHIAIVTTKYRAAAMPSILHFGLDRFIDRVIALDDVQRPKPDPEPLLLATKFFSSRKAVMVGDTPSDLNAGKNAGVLTCGVGWSYKKAEILALRPDFWIEDFSELISKINEYNEEE